MPLRYRFLTVGSLAGLALGFALGLVGNRAESPAIDSVMQFLAPFEGFWIGALRIVVLPLIVSYLVLAVTAAVESRTTGKIGAIAVASHVGLLLVVTLFTISVGPAILHYFPLSPDAIGAFQESAITTTLLPLEGAASVGRSPFASLLINVYASIVSVDIVVLVIISAVFAVILARTASRFRMPVLSFFKAVSKMSMYAVDGLLIFMPLLIVIVTHTVTVKIGAQFVGTIAYWLVLLSSMLLVATLGVYAAAVYIGGVSLSKFVRALAPVQILGIASRSSLVCLPKLIEAGRDGLGQGEHISGIVLPLSVSTFKLNRMVSTPMNLFFLVHLYGIDLDPSIAATLIFTAMIVSFATPGIPSGGKFTTLPIYLAAGVPVEGVVLLKAVDVIPDIFKTIINVTEDLTIATIVARFVLDNGDAPSDSSF